MAPVSLVAGAILAGLLWCSVAGAVTFEQHKPNYLITRHSPEAPDSTAPTWLEGQVSIRLPLMELTGLDNKLVVPYFPDGNPMLALSIHFWWRIMDESSPFDELDWNPQVYYAMFQNDSIPLVGGVTFEGVAVGWEHVSTGVAGDASRGWDRFIPEAKGKWKAITVYLRPWWTFNYDQFTEEIADVVNIRGSDYGFEGIAKLELSSLTLAGTFGNGYQDYELTIPFPAPWNVDFYVQAHTGTNESLVRYEEDTPAFGGGIVLKQ